MSQDNSSALLIDAPGQSILEEQIFQENEKCIFKLEGEIISDVQETKNNLFNCDFSKII